MNGQTNRSEIDNDVKKIWTWLWTRPFSPCLLIGKQPKEKRLFKRRINFLAAFPIGVILQKEDI
jgi:hypothetical protein